MDYIASISATIVILLFRNLRRTPIKQFRKSGPVHNDEFKRCPLLLAAASNTTLILSVFRRVKHRVVWKIPSSIRYFLLFLLSQFHCITLFDVVINYLLVFTEQFRRSL